MNTKEKLALIDTAIDDVLAKLGDGIEIKEYWIDNIKVVKRSPLELIKELRKIRELTLSTAQNKANARHKSFIFGDRY